MSTETRATPYAFKIIESPFEFTRRDAEFLVEQIKAFWRYHGRTVHLWINREQRNSRDIYVVRSNMLNGLPR